MAEENVIRPIKVHLAVCVDATFVNCQAKEQCSWKSQVKIRVVGRKCPPSSLTLSANVITSVAVTVRKRTCETDS